MVFLVLAALLLGIITFFAIAFFRVLLAMRDDILFPIELEDLQSVKITPLKHVKSPTFSEQKVGIIVYAIAILFAAAMIFTLWHFQLELVPLLFFMAIAPLFHTKDLLNQFAVTKTGVMAGVRFMGWKQMKYYEWINIDKNHFHYGHAEDVNNSYELKIYGKLFSISCIVTTEETKEKLTGILAEKEIRTVEPVIDDGIVQKSTNIHKGKVGT